MVKSFHWGHLAPYGDGMGLTPLDIQQQRFRSRFGGGLDKAEVDAFLNLVATEMEKLVRDNNELREDQRATRRLLEDYRSREDTLKETMITAQKVTEEIKRAADKEADIILGRAELDAERIIERLGYSRPTGYRYVRELVATNEVTRIPHSSKICSNPLFCRGATI